MSTRTRRTVRRSVLWLGLSACAAALAAAPAMEPTRLLRTPTVSATHIAFAYANNIWAVERGGGLARRLTSFQGQTSNPHFSPDGSLVAFSAEYAGNTDVYVVPAAGGEPRRLTWHPGADLAQGWTPDGQSVLFASGRATWAPSGAPRFWTVPAAGGIEEPLPLPRAYQGKLSPDGTRVAYRMNTSWDEERRNYRGGQNRPIWIVDLKTFELVSPPWTDSWDKDPAWIGDTVYFISDRDGVANVWSFDTKAKKLAQVTKFRDFDVKALDANAGAVVFEQAGVIHLLDPKSGSARAVEITATGDFPWMMPRWEDVTSRMTNLALSPTGKRIVVEARGEIFTIPAEKGDVRNLTNSSGSAERDPAWSPDGKYVSYFSDKSGEYKLVVEEQEGLKPPREIALPNPTHYYTPSWSPDSKKLLYHDTNLKVWVLDIESGKAKVVGDDPWMVPQRTLAPVWSPDSKWVAYASRLKSLYRAIVVTNVDTGEVKQVTDGLADAMYPVFDASGKYLWFLASTDFGLRSQWLDMTSYDREENFGLYLAVLKKGEPSPLLPESDEEGAPAAPKEGARPGGRAAGGGADAAAQAAGEQAEQPAGAKPAPRAPVTVQIDFDGLQQRVISVAGVPERQYSQLRPGAAGTVFYLEAQAGAGPGGGSTLQRYRLSDRKAAAFATGVAAYAVSADGKKLLYRAGGEGGAGRGGGAPGAAPAPSLFLVDADKAPPAAGQGRISATLRMHLEPKEEFRQIFNEGWRNQRDYLYVPNMHGTDWPKMKQMYGQFLQHVRHRADLNYLLDNMGAEIAIGHSYVRGGDMPEVPRDHRRPARRGLRCRGRALQDRAHLRHGELEPRAARAAGCAGHRGVGGRLHPRDQRRRASRAGQHLPPARRHGEPPDGADRRQQARDGRRAPGDGGSGGKRTGPPHAGVGRVEPPPGRHALRRPDRVRLRAQHRPARLHLVQPVLLRAAGQEGRRDRRALQRRRLCRRLHHRSPAARLRRLLQQRGRRSVPVHQPVGRHLGAEGDDHQRDGRLGRRSHAVHVQAPQDRPPRGHAHMGRPRPYGRHAAVHRRRVDDRAARRVLHARHEVGRRERGRRPRHRRRELAEGRHRRQGPAARARRRRGAAAAGREAGRSGDEGAAAAGVGNQERLSSQ